MSWLVALIESVSAGCGVQCWTSVDGNDCCTDGVA
jgi:hypothetical protein